MRNRRPARHLLILPALLAVLGLVACGGDEEDPQQVIDQAFSEPIESADVTLNADLAFEDSEELAEPIRVQLSGPFRSGGEKRIPSFDFQVALQGGGSEVPPLGLVSTGENIFVDIQGVAYEVGETVVGEQNRQLARRQSQDAPGLGALGVDPSDWIVDPDVEGDAEVAGVPTTHVSASVDVPALVTDLNDAAQQATAIGAGPAPALTDEQQAALEEAVEEPTFDVFVGEEDRKLRRLATTVEFEVPEDSREGLGGATSGTLSFTLELANVGGDQEIEAPENPQPLADLARQIGGLGGVLGDPQAPALPPPEGGELTVPQEPEVP